MAIVLLLLTSCDKSMRAVCDELMSAKRGSARVRARFNERAFVDYAADSSGWEVVIREFEDRTRDAGTEC